MKETDAEVEALRAFHGTPAHRALLARFRRALIAELAYFMSNPWEEKAMQTCHCRLRAMLEVFTSQDFRLDNIDIPQLSSEAVSQFESSLPSRIEFNQEFAQRNSEEV